MITKRNSSSISPHLRAGLSLVEILIALTMTLIVLGAMMSAFQYASAEMQEGRAVLEMANRVRVTENLLRRDLANLTVEPRPYIDKTIPNGYFEYVEGPNRDLQFPFGIDQDGDGVPVSMDPDDSTAATTAELQTLNANTIQNPTNSYLGDVDDILAMTVRSVAGEVFRGRIQGSATPAESTYAEVVWWTLLDDSDNNSIIDYTENVSVFRRALVINPELTITNPAGGGTTFSYAQALQWLKDSDVSVRLVPAGGLFNIVPNSLQDLANRRNRFARFSTDVDGDGAVDDFASVTRFPHFLNRGSLEATFSSNGSDIMLTDVAAFDVKVLEPMALVFEASGVLIEPCSPGYMVDNTASCTHVGTGGVSDLAPDADGDMINDTAGRSSAYVNLGYPDVALMPVPGDLSGAAGIAGLGGTGRFSQPASPAGFASGNTGLVPKGVLNYQFNFHNPSAPVTSLMDTAYDTWTPQYESDGINQDTSANNSQFAERVRNGDTNVDEGTDGIDNDNANGPDDFDERETIPPYLEPIRALKVTIRLVEKQTGQVRQSSIVQRYDAQ